MLETPRSEPMVSCKESFLQTVESRRDTSVNLAIVRSPLCVHQEETRGQAKRWCSDGTPAPTTTSNLYSLWYKKSLASRHRP